MYKNIKKRNSASVIATKLFENIKLEEEKKNEDVIPPKPDHFLVGSLTKDNFKDYVNNGKPRKNNGKSKSKGHNEPIDTRCLLTTG